MTSQNVRHLWELALNGNSLLTRVLALVRLTELEPERVNEMYRNVNTYCSADRGSSENDISGGNSHGK